MKKNIMILFLFLFTFISSTMVVKAADNFDAGDCIKNFGEISDLSAGDKNFGGGRVLFHNKDNHTTWNDGKVTFDVEVQSKPYHKVKTIHYSINSKDGYSCTGVISGSDIENNSGSVTLHVVIDKGWVDDMAFWGKTVDRRDATKGDTTKSNKVSVKREMTEEELKAINEELEVGAGEKLTCKTIDDLLGKYWSWVMILAPVATMLLITIDFVNPIISSDSEALKKAGDKALKRTIALVILLVLPLIVSMLFSLFGIETCF